MKTGKKQRSSKRNIPILLIICLLLQGWPFLQAQTMVTVYPEEYPGALKNPLKGFRPNTNDAGNADHPYTTIARDYIRWNQIENNASDGVQKIIDFCNAKWEGLEELNVKVIPRVYLDWDSSTGNEYWPADLTDGDWTSAEFKERVINMIYKLGEAWDNDPRVAWVQTGIIGYWGEQENPVGVDEDGWAKRMGAAFDSAFKNKKLIVRNQPPWDAEGYKYGVYWDSYGHPGQTSGSWSRIRQTNSQGRYLDQVIEGEVAYNWGESVFDPLYGGEPEITLNNYQYTNNMIDVIRELHCTGLGWIASYDLDGSFGTNPDSIRANAERMQKAFGYRYLIPEFSCSSRADQGGNLDISFKVKNVGSAPFYEDWPLAFVLIDEATGAIVWKEILPDVDIRNWLPGNGYNYSTHVYDIPAQEYSIDASLPVPDNFLSGQYLAGISILDPMTQTPGIFFAVRNFLATNQIQPLIRIGIGEDLQGDYNVTATSDDLLLNDTRFYSTSAENFSVSINYPAEGASIVPQIEIPVYISAYNNLGTIDSVQLYVNGILDSTAYSSPFLFSMTNLPADFYTIEVRAYDDQGSLKSDSKTFTVQYPGGVPWVEQFNLPNGTKSDNGSTAWTSTRGGGVFEVRSGAFEISDGKGYIGDFTTGVIKTYGVPVTVSLDVEALSSGLDAGEDYVELYKKVDGVEMLIDRVTGYQSKTFSESNIIGNELQLVVKAYVTFVSEIYHFDNLSVTYDVQPELKYLSLNINGNGSIDPSAGIHPYYENADVSILAVPSYGYKLDYWSGDYSGTDNPITIIMDTEKSITANFIELSKYSLSVSSDNGTVSLSDTSESYYEGTAVLLTAIPDEGYKFAAWSGDLTGNTNPESILMDADKNVTALFEEIPSYTLTTNISNGTITLDPVGGSYQEATVVTLTVTPDEGYEFLGWSDDLTGSVNPATILMNEDKTVTALINEIPVYSLTVDAANGTVSLDPAGGSYETGTLVSLTATANEGYEFNGWNGDLSGTSNPETITMNKDMIVTAIFSEIVHVIGLLNDIPGESSLGQNVPNPFHAETTVPYKLAKASNVELTVYNYLGQQVAVLVNDHQAAGKYRIVWRPGENPGIKISDGLYVMRLKTDNEKVFIRKSILMK